MKMLKFEIFRPFLGAAAATLAMMFAPAVYSDDPITDAAFQIFQAPDVQSNAQFGFSVAGVGDKVLIGAQAHNVGGLTNAGQAYLFNQDGILLQTFQAPDAQAGALFGASVAAVENMVLVSAPVHNIYNGVNRAGQVYFFDPDGTLLLTFQSPDPRVGTRFGVSVAGSALGRTILVGADEHPVNELPNAGRAYLFNTNGTLLQTFHAPDAQAGARFGWSVAWVGEKILVGAREHNNGELTNAGKVYLFDPDGTLLQTFEAPDAQAGALFGWKVAAVANKVLVGAHMHDIDRWVPQTNAGQAYLFDPDGTLLQTFQAPHPLVDARFGFSVAGVGEKVLIGAIGNFADMLTNAGQAYLFDLNGALLQTIQAPNAQAFGSFGSSVAAVGETFLVGASRHNVGMLTNAGQAYLFGVESDPVAIIDQLLNAIDELQAAANLNQGQGNALAATLINAFESIESDQLEAACGELGAFINQVGALISSGQLSEEVGGSLIVSAEAAMESLCG